GGSHSCQPRGTDLRAAQGRWFRCGLAEYCRPAAGYDRWAPDWPVAPPGFHGCHRARYQERHARLAGDADLAAVQRDVGAGGGVRGDDVLLRYGDDWLGALYGDWGGGAQDGSPRRKQSGSRLMLRDGRDVIRVMSLSVEIRCIGSISFGYHRAVRDDWSQP